MSSHSHKGGHEGHSHSHAPKNETKLAIAALLTGGFMLAEVFGGLISGSLALLADAGHMLTDFASLMLAWMAMRLARRPADWKLTYGFGRFSVLAAFVNGLSLIAICVWIVIEAIQRLSTPHEVMGTVMLWISLGGLLVNIIAFWVLTRGEDNNLNVRAAALHVAGDLLGSIAAIVASVVIIFTGWTPIDPILSVLVVVLILRSALSIVKESGQILLEGTPEGFDPRAVSEAIARDVEGVAAVHHVHAWSVTQELPVVTLELAVASGHVADEVKAAVKAYMHEHFSIEHITVETVTG